ESSVEEVRFKTLVPHCNRRVPSRPKCVVGANDPELRLATDSPLERTRFELVWGFSCQVSFSFGAGSLFGAGKPFFVPSPAIRFAERAERGQGTETVAKLGGLPLSGACVSQRLRPEYAER